MQVHTSVKRTKDISQEVMLNHYIVILFKYLNYLSFLLDRKLVQPILTAQHHWRDVLCIKLC